jgi:hypothetical protein
MLVLAPPGWIAAVGRPLASNRVSVPYVGVQAVICTVP